MTCFGFLKDIPEVLKSNLSNLKWGLKHSTVVSGNSKNSKGETKGSADEGRKTSGSETTGGSGKTGGSETVGSQKSVMELYEERARNLRVFTLTELKAATNNFTPELKIGEGGFGSVYRAFIKPADGSGERILVAVKRLNRNGLQGHKEWVAEVQLLGIADHPNVVKLIGYCAVDGERGMQRLLVYEFMPNRSLEDHLFKAVLPVLPWDKRLQVALGTAQGLAYLHEELEVQVIFRDFKASNVLLDMDFRPRLSDFGLAREGPAAGRTHVTTAVVGTAGYAAPEYVRTGHLTAKSDVWSFGVVLYELLTGRRSIVKNLPKKELKLLEWVKGYPADSRKFGMIIDPRLGNEYSLAAARAMAKLADSCLSKLSRNRPEMSKVVETLKKIIEISKCGNSQNLTVQPAESDSVGSDERLDKDSVSDCRDNGPDNSRRKVSPVTRLRKENGHVFGGRRFVMMSQRHQQLQQHQQQLRQHRHQQQRQLHQEKHEQLQRPENHGQQQQEHHAQQQEYQEQHQHQEHHAQQREHQEQLQQREHHAQPEQQHQEQHEERQHQHQQEQMQE